MVTNVSEDLPAPRLQGTRHHVPGDLSQQSKLCINFDHLMLAVMHMLGETGHLHGDDEGLVIWYMMCSLVGYLPTFSSLNMKAECPS
jgi:hypothetical protein